MEIFVKSSWAQIDVQLALAPETAPEHPGPAPLPPSEAVVAGARRRTDDSTVESRDLEGEIILPRPDPFGWIRAAKAAAYAALAKYQTAKAAHEAALAVWYKEVRRVEAANLLTASTRARVEAAERAFSVYAR